MREDDLDAHSEASDYDTGDTIKESLDLRLDNKFDHLGAIGQAEHCWIQSRGLGHCAFESEYADEGCELVQRDI